MTKMANFPLGLAALYGAMEVSGNHFRGENCKKSEPFAKGLDFDWSNITVREHPETSMKALWGSHQTLLGSISRHFWAIWGPVYW
jgi:hypothetical protein